MKSKQIRLGRNNGFFNDHMLGSGGGSLPLIVTVGSTGSTATQISGDLNRPGILRLSSGLGNGAWACARGNHSLNLGGGKFGFSAGLRIISAPTAAENSSFTIGFSDVVDNSTFTDAVCLFGAAGNNWLWIARNNGTTTTVDSGVPITSNSWFDMSIQTYNSGASAICNIAGVEKTITTNIPKTAGRETGIAFQSVKTAGTTLASIIDLDYYSFEWELN
jgi:hypothetical protein